MTNAEWALPAEKVVTGGLMMTRWGRDVLSALPIPSCPLQAQE